jgi:hypothetical protein
MIRVTIGSRPNFVVIGDFNKDSKFDIVVSNDGTNGIGILYGYANFVLLSIVFYL